MRSIISSSHRNIKLFGGLPRGAGGAFGAAAALVNADVVGAAAAPLKMAAAPVVAVELGLGRGRLVVGSDVAAATAVAVAAADSVPGAGMADVDAVQAAAARLVMAAIIDTGVASGDKTYIMRMCMVLVLLAVIGLTCSITAQYFAAKAAVGFATKLRHALFAHIESLSFTEMDTVGTATLITRMTSDVNQVQNGVNLVLRLFLRSPFIVFGAMVMAFTIDIKAALVFVVTIPLLSVIVFGIMLISIPLYKKVQSALDKVLGITRENLTGSRVIRAFNKEEDEREHFNENNDLLTRAQIYVGKISALMNPLTYVIINGAIVVLVWTGAVRVDNGYITQGQVVALINYMSQILVELVKLANLIIKINKSIACYRGDIKSFI